MSSHEKLTVIQTLPALDAGGVERGTLQIAEALVKHGHRSIVISAGGRLVEELQDIGSEHITLSIGKKSPRSLLHIPVLRKILSESGANILHARSRLPAWISYLAWKGMPIYARPRFITSVHGHYSVNRYSKIMLAGERVIAVSKSIYRYIILNYPHVQTEKIVIIPRGVSNLDFPYEFKPDLGWQKRWHEQFPSLRDRTLITLPGRITRWKGQEDFLEILSRLLTNQRNNVHGLIVGGPHPGKENYYEELQAKAKSMGLQERITFTGHRSDLREIMSISSLVLSLSNDPEAFGRTVLEALSLGTPVIAYAHGGAGEVLQTIFPAGLIPKCDIESAVAQIGRFLDSVVIVPDNNPYTLQRMQDSTLALYEDLARTARP